ncbi:hypothetical protein GJAV_G00269120 [Gymnothorax javanicus]|nr:hypothetical protein GJAV_G00269120 [Gymnothorax javanicus]
MQGDRCTAELPVKELMAARALNNDGRWRRAWRLSCSFNDECCSWATHIKVSKGQPARRNSPKFAAGSGSCSYGFVTAKASRLVKRRRRHGLQEEQQRLESHRQEDGSHGGRQVSEVSRQMTAQRDDITFSGLTFYAEGEDDTCRTESRGCSSYRVQL